MSDAIAVVADSLLEGVPSPPTHLDALASKLGISSIKKETMPISGELRRIDRSFEVVYSADLPPNRQRFTIAHEMAHAYFKLKDGKCRNTEELERLCDMLAIELLMPRSGMRGYKSSDLSPARILEISRQFGVSLRAAAIRCYELFNTSIFEVVDEEITWGCGVIREGPVARIHDGDIRAVVREASRGSAGERILFIEKDGVPRRHLICYAPLSKQHGRALLLIKRAAAA
jgi:hypothetical protein